MPREKVTELANKLIPLASQIDNAGLIFDKICKSVELLKHRSVCFSPKVNAWMEWPPFQAMNSKMNISNDDHVPRNTSPALIRSSATYHSAESEPFLFQNTHFLNTPPPQIVVEGVPSISFTTANSSPLF